MARQSVAAAGWTGQRFAEQGLDLVFPPRCGFCDAELRHERQAGGTQLCVTCCDRLGPPGRTACPRCGAAVPALVVREEGCDHCRRRTLRFERAVALGSYEGALRTAVLRMKHAPEEP